MPDYLGSDMRKTKPDDKKEEEKEIKGTLINYTMVGNLTLLFFVTYAIVCMLQCF